MISFTIFHLFVVFAAAVYVQAVTVKITPLGDSLTGGPGCWRAYLWQKLQVAGVTNTDFVGTQPSGGCAFTFDGEHEGHGGFKATGIVADNQLPGWLAYSQPDMVMMMLGTNDVWSSLPTATIITAFGTLVDQMRAQKSTIRILVAKIPPMKPGGCDTCNWPGQVVSLNAAIELWAPTKSTSTSPITVVDCWTGFVSSDFTDGVHPNDSGTQKLANCWFEPVKAAILAFGGSSSTSSSTLTRITTTAVRMTTTSTTPVRTTVSTTTTLRTTTTSARTSTTAAGSGGSPVWGQCGGNGWTGPTTCLTGSTCVYSNPWYSQCLPP